MGVRDIVITAIAPVAWGSTYLVTETFLPPDRPLFDAAMRALPAGLVLLAFRRRLPHGDWWWKAVVLGICNIGMFFPLIFLAAYQLPGGLAATLQATSPLAVMALAWLAIGERPGTVRILSALVGLVGVGLLVMRTPGDVSTLGLLAAFGSVLVSALGFVLVKRWPAPVDMLTLVSWQLVVGGAVLVPVFLLVEGAPPHLGVGNVAGLLWLATAGTAIAYACWFRGLGRMPAGALTDDRQCERHHRQRRGGLHGRGEAAGQVVGGQEDQREEQADVADAQHDRPPPPDARGELPAQGEQHQADRQRPHGRREQRAVGRQELLGDDVRRAPRGGGDHRQEDEAPANSFHGRDFIFQRR